MKTIIYPGTFDPVTKGHVDLIHRALNIFDHIIVTVSDHPEKQPMFSLEERKDFIKTIFKKDARVKVDGFRGLLVEFMKEKNIHTVLRGLRVVSDFDYEFQMASMNRQLDPALETIFLTPADCYAYVSSSLIREIIRRGGDVSKFVPEIVCQKIKKEVL